MENLKKTLASVPTEPGIYLYHNRADIIVYVGKAKNLRNRVKQYFQSDDTLPDKTRQLVSEIARIETVTTTSEFEALLLEAKLIRQYMPKYNVISRDDKSPLYVVLTLSEQLPRILTVRKREVETIAKGKNSAVYGPFQSAYALRTVLRQIRTIVPYCIQKQRNGRPCFYTHLGLCSPCPSYISGVTGVGQKALIAEYRKNIFRLKAIFDGKLNVVRSQYEKEMRELARLLRFEQADDMKKRLSALYGLVQFRYDPAVFMERGSEDVYREQLDELYATLKSLYPNLTALHRIECYDMSQLYGESAVGSMVVVTDGRIDTSSYRKFRIRQTGGRSDTDLMKEVLTRRLRHDEWPLPDFLLVDGGKGQVRAAGTVLMKAGVTLPYGGLAKRQEELIVPSGDGFRTLRLPLTGKAIKVLQRIRDEAHRFAITYHRLIRNKRWTSAVQ